MLCSLQDRAEIDDLLARYCMALDTQSWAEFPQILTEDVTWDYSDEFGTVHHGIEEVVDAIRGIPRLPPARPSGFSHAHDSDIAGPVNPYQGTQTRIASKRSVQCPSRPISS